MITGNIMSKLYWFLAQQPNVPPTTIYKYPRHSQTSVSICPQTKKLDKKILEIDMPYHLKIERNKQGIFNFISKDVDQENIQYENPILNVTSFIRDEDIVIHFVMPYCFMSDDKDLEGYQMMVKSNTKHKFNGAEIIEGLLPVGRYGRIIDLALYVPKNTKVELFKGEPIFRLVFNKDVDIKHIVPTDAIIEYTNSIGNVTKYTKGVKDIFKKALITYPYKELSKCDII
jgi:hypothetical protein